MEAGAEQQKRHVGRIGKGTTAAQPGSKPTPALLALGDRVIDNNVPVRRGRVRIGLLTPVSICVLLDYVFPS